jgi:hypothetical protein
VAPRVSGVLRTHTSIVYAVHVPHPHRIHQEPILRPMLVQPCCCSQASWPGPDDQHVHLHRPAWSCLSQLHIARVQGRQAVCLASIPQTA